MNELLTEVGKSGPWAGVAGFLLWTVIKAWDGDRRALTALLGEFKQTLEGLRSAVEHLSDRLERVERIEK